MLHRKIEREIENWLADDPRGRGEKDKGMTDKALLLNGVRQAGKTYIIRQCLKSSAYPWVEFNLIAQPDLVPLIDGARDVDDLILKLSLYSEEVLIPGKTVLFFDEIQKCREIVTKIKFLVEDGRFRYILSGSLLGVEMVNLRSAPVGYLKILPLYPLDFEEFLQVFHISSEIIDLLRESYQRKQLVDTVLHQKLMDIFSLYLIIGGMPAAVETYRTTENIDAVMAEHQAIMDLYQLDFTQYEEDKRKLFIREIYDQIPAALNQKNKRFKLADLQKNLRFDRVEDSFTWLWKAGVALGVFNVTEPKIPLLLNIKHNLFKVFLSDVGLLTTRYGKNCKLKIMTHDRDLNQGAIYENVVAQELHAHGIDLFYYNSKKRGELDFVLEHEGEVLPIEVKSGKDYLRHSALSQIMKEEAYGIPEAVVLTQDNVQVKGKITYLPIYMTMFLGEEPQGFVDLSVEKFSL